MISVRDFVILKEIRGIFGSLLIFYKLNLFAFLRAFVLQSL